ncbi:MAG: hypothetical protein LBC85_01475 [Fibromonadaceae bacterium]|nr:hypothetical protein [Fibromonadaceae bacterium]
MLGPNIEYGMQGSAAPAGLRGAFVPQASANFSFSWLEPLGKSGYGVWKPNKTNYLRFLGEAELSPFYGTVRAGIGIAPFPAPFAVLELRLVYSNENLLWSDVEMAMKQEDIPSINETWNAGYIFDHFYKKSSYSQIQSFGAQLGGKYSSKKIDISFLFNFALIDITSDYDKKSFDYMRGIPLYSRDYVLKDEFSAAYHFGEQFSWNLDLFAVLSGQQLKLSSKTYDKEPLAYYTISTGPSWRLNGGRSYFSISPGFFTRNSKHDDFNDPIKERILLSVQYKHFWDFRFGKQ